MVPKNKEPETELNIFKTEEMQLKSLKEC